MAGTASKKFIIDGKDALATLEGLRKLAASTDDSMKKAASSADRLVKEIEKIKADAAFERMKRSSKAYGDALSQLEAAQQSGATTMREFATGIGMVGAAAAAAAAKIYDMARAGEKAQAIERTFTQLGGSAQELQKLRDATNNLVPDSALVQMSNMAKTMKISEGAIEAFAQAAVGASARFGTSVEKNFGDLLSGTARQSKMILDNLGVVMKSNEEIFKGYAEQIGIGAENFQLLTDSQRRAAYEAEVVNSVLPLQETAAKAGAQAVAELDTKWQNFLGTLEVAAAKGVVSFLDGVERHFSAEAEAAHDAKVAMNDMNAEYRRMAEYAKIATRVDSLEDLLRMMPELQEEFGYTVNEFNELVELYQDGKLNVDDLSDSVASYAVTLGKAQISQQLMKESTERLSNAIGDFAAQALEHNSQQEKLDAANAKREKKRASERRKRHRERLAQMKKEREEMLRSLTIVGAQLQGELSYGAIGSFLMGEGTLAGGREGGLLSNLLKADANADLTAIIKPKLDEVGAFYSRWATNFGSTGGAAGFGGEAAGGGGMFGDLFSSIEKGTQGLSDVMANPVDSFGTAIDRGQQWIKTAAEIAEANREITLSAVEIGQSIGSALGSAIATGESFRETMFGIMGDLFGQLGSAFLAWATAEGALLSGNPIAAAVAAVALTGIASAISSFGSRDTGAAASAQRAPQQQVDRQQQQQGSTIIIENHGLSMNDDDALRVGRAIQRFNQLGGRYS